MSKLISKALALSLTLVTAACGSGNPASPSSASSGASPSGAMPSSNSSSPANASSPCRITSSAPNEPVTAAEGPYYHYVAFGRTTDGLTVTGTVEALYHASVPDGVLMPDGSVGVYYVNGEGNGVWFGRITGSTITPESAISIDGFIRPEGVVDPDATVVNGKVRLAYLAGFGTNLGASRAICIAESVDGLSFTTLGEAWPLGAGATQTDPSMIRLRDGSWLMAISDGTSTRLGRSSDGVTFTQFSATGAGGVPELSLLGDGRVRLYVCATGGITAHVSADSGITWTQEAVVVPNTVFPGRRTICDPSFVPGADLFLFKTF